MGNFPLTKNLSQAITFTAAADTTNPIRNFKIDRIGAFVHNMTGGSIPQAAVHLYSSSGVGAKWFDLEPLYNDDRHTDYFMAPRDAQPLARGIRYMVVFTEGGGSNESYKLYATEIKTEDTQADSGWPIEDAGLTKDDDAGTPSWGGMKSGDSSSGASVVPQIRVYAGVAE